MITRKKGHIRKKYFFRGDHGIFSFQVGGDQEVGLDSDIFFQGGGLTYLGGDDFQGG